MDAGLWAMCLADACGEVETARVLYALRLNFSARGQSEQRAQIRRSEFEVIDGSLGSADDPEGEGGGHQGA